MIDFRSALSDAATYLGATVADDEVFIMDSQSYSQLFRYARPLRLRVREPSKIMKHPLEDGSTITDHLVVEPIKIEIPMAFIRNYKDTISQFKSVFDQGKLLTIQTKAKAYENMVLTEIPHEEDTDFFNILMANLRFEEARFVTPEYGELSQSQAKNKSDVSTTKRGSQQTTATSSTDASKAASAYQGAQPKSSGSTLHKMFN